MCDHSIRVFSHGRVFLFFMQKTAYEVLRSLVGSEMCIRDSGSTFLDNINGKSSAKKRRSR